MERSLNKMLEASFKKNWDCAALSDFKGITLHYRDVARRIEKLHIIFNICGVEKGDRIAICSRNQANWGVVFLACLTYGAVPVPILHEFKPGNVHHIVNHSDSRVLFVGDMVWENLNGSEMTNLEAIILINENSLDCYTDITTGNFMKDIYCLSRIKIIPIVRNFSVIKHWF